MVVEHQTFLYGYQIVRIVAVGKVMWTVERFSIPMRSDAGEWSAPVRRKVLKWRRVRPGVAPEQVHLALKEAVDAYRQAMQRAEADLATASFALTEDAAG